MPVSQTDRTNAGNAYSTALDAFVTAFVELYAIDQLLRSAGSFSTTSCDTDALILFRHPQFAPNAGNPRVSDRIRTRMDQLR
jgi:hypothetical protein